MFHLSIFRKAAPAAAQVGADVPAVTDPAVTISNAFHPIFEQDVEVPIAYGFGSTTLTRFRVATPKLRTFPLPNIVPVDLATIPTSRPPYQDWWNAPLKLNRIDENQVLVDDPTAATDLIAAVWFCDGNYSAPAGDIREVHGTYAYAALADVWTPGSFTLDQPLPAGTYTVVGMKAFGANLAFARLIFPQTPTDGSPQWRPGIVAGLTSSFIGIQQLLEGRMGKYGEFRSYAQPQLDIFPHGGAGTAGGDLYLQLIKVA